ncbi:MAG: tetratricopeptide repeat protein, partial [Chloroflexota bacterium]
VNLATAYLLADRYEEAITCAADVLQRAEQIGDTWVYTVALATLAEANLYLNNLKEAAEFANRAIQAEDASVLPDVLRIMGTILLRQGNAEVAAEQYILEAIEMARQVKDRYLEAYGYRALAEVYQVLAQTEHEMAAFKDAITIFKELGLGKEIMKTIELAQGSQNRYIEACGYRALGEVYQAQGRVADATAEFDNAIAIFKELGLDKEIVKTKSMMTKG